LYTWCTDGLQQVCLCLSRHLHREKGIIRLAGSLCYGKGAACASDCITNNECIEGIAGIQAVMQRMLAAARCPILPSYDRGLYTRTGGLAHHVGWMISPENHNTHNRSFDMSCRRESGLFMSLAEKCSSSSVLLRQWDRLPVTSARISSMDDANELIYVTGQGTGNLKREVKRIIVSQGISAISSIPLYDSIAKIGRENHALHTA